MSQIPGIAVTYIGADDPFIDRLYRSGLTFEPNQTRIVPPQLAERFLRHTDVFERVKSAEELALEAAAAQLKADQAKADAEELAKKQAADEAEAKRLADKKLKDDADQLVKEAQDKADALRLQAEGAAALAKTAQTANTLPGTTVDDTQLQLEAAEAEKKKQEQLDEARFQLLNNIEGMNKPALLDFIQDKFGQKLPANIGEAKLRERARGMVDQFGVP